MSYPTYRQEALAAREVYQNLAKKQSDTCKPDTIGWHMMEVKVLAAKIVYHDRMYDLYYSVGDDVLANRQRKYMEDAIAKKMELSKHLNDLCIPDYISSK